MNLFVLVLIILLLGGIGVAPGWGYHNYGWGPSGWIGFLLLILLIVFLVRGG